jgi:hypothetical protein
MGQERLEVHHRPPHAQPKLIKRYGHPAAALSVREHILNRYIFRRYYDYVLILPRGDRIPSSLVRQERLMDSPPQHVLDRFAVHDQPLVWQFMFDCHGLASQNLRHSSG